MVIHNEIVEVLKTTYDPELGIDLHTLGLIYKIDFDEKKQNLHLTMTLTSPLCPFGAQIMEMLQRRFKELGLTKVDIALVFDPPWEPSAEVRQMLNV